jgi:diguanylate cyclase (GGDEF)-like protein
MRMATRGGDGEQQPGLPTLSTVRRTPFTTRAYLVGILTVSLLALVGASVYAYVWSTKHATSGAVDSMTFRSSRAAQHIAAGVTSAKDTVSGLAQQGGVERVFDDPTGCQLTATGSAAFSSVRLDIVAPDGTVVCSSDPGTTVSKRLHAGSDWLAQAMQPGTHVRWDGHDAVGDVLSVVVSNPVEKDGAVVGVVVGFLHLPHVALDVAQDLQGVQGATFTLVDHGTGRVVSSSVPTGASADGRFPLTARSGEHVGLDGKPRVFGSADVPGSTLRVYAGADRAVVLSQSRGSLLRQLLVGLLAALVLIAGAVLLDRRLARPLRRLTRAVARAGQGADSVRVDEQGTAEVLALSRQFNAMMDARAGHEAQLMHQASHDALTGLPNRLLLAELIDGVLGGDEQHVSLLMLGIDRFKLINDGLGHEAADAILKEVAQRLSTTLRAGDTLARFGGDEFVLLLPGAGQAAAEEVAQRMHDTLAEPFTAPGAEVVIRASIGISVVWSRSIAPEQVVRLAVAAMRYAKSAGQVTSVFDETLEVRATYQLDVERDLRRALEQGELVVHYQPLIDISARAVVGAEALLRWQHPERGLVPPLEFIPVAEQSGQIKEIGAFVLERACRDGAAWAAAGHPLRISVNVAVAQLKGGDFARQVADVLTETGLPSHLLCLEITESSLMRSDQRRTEGLAALRDLGVHLAIDDFGTGYSSLAYLHSLPVDELKIDRSFVNRLGSDSRDRHLVQAIIGMGTALGLTVVAEGVETEEQLAYLGERGCDVAQGFLFSPPQPVDVFRAHLASMPVGGTAAQVRW